MKKKIESLLTKVQKLVVEFVELLQRQTKTGNQSMAQNHTVALPANQLTKLTELLPQGYEGDAIADSEALYNDG